MVYDKIMTNDDKNEFKVLIKEGTIEALKSSEGQDAIVSALNSEKGQEVLVKSFVKGYHAMVEPILEDISDDVEAIKIELKYVKDRHESKISRLERKVGLVI